MNSNCPVCESELTKSDFRSDYAYLECPRCGAYCIGDRAVAILNAKARDDRNVRAKVSHSIYKMSSPGQWPKIGDQLLRSIVENTDLPLPLEQLDNLITWLGRTQPDPGTAIEGRPQAIAAIGAVDYNALGFIVSAAKQRDLLTGEVKIPQGLGEARDCVILPMRLTLGGWERFEELRRGRASGRVAFMAMPFGISEFETLYREHFRPAVAATGFTLKRLDESQPAGLIDDRLRVEIRQSRFLIADLTNRNPGAYWESGYAEGIGKPVIYTCRQDVFDDKRAGPHFDTNHHLTVVWNPGAMEAASAKLKDTIRATLPAEASLTDI